MKKRVIYICLLIFVASCENNSVLDSQETLESNSVSTRSMPGYTMFQNVIRYESAASASMYGDIYCPEAAEYTFIFRFVGSVGTRYFAHVGDKSLYPSNGFSFRTVTAKLKAGTNTLDIGVNFSGANQQAEMRLVIDKINGKPLYNEDGFVDLAMMASSKLTDFGGGSEAYHWMCGGCRALNSMSYATCVSCGHSK